MFDDIVGIALRGVIEAFSIRGISAGWSCMYTIKDTNGVCCLRM